MKCGVCIEEYTKRLRKKVECPYCGYNDACSTCIQQYLLSTPETPHCMSCRKAWSRSFLVETFTSKFVNGTYKKHRENVLFEAQKALMPGTQDDVVRAIEKKKYTREIVEYQTTINILQGELAYMHIETLEQKEISCNVRRQIFDLQMKIDCLQFRLTNDKHTVERKQFIRSCPVNNCKGFLSTQWKCGLCDTYTCKDCLEVKTDGHECNPENVESAKLIKTESRPCPSCAAPIMKIEGCDQMYCTSCHTAFSWRTGRIETGRIHNPHYYDYMRRRGQLNREIGDIQCGGMPDVYHILRRLKHGTNERRLISDLHREITHFQFVELNRYTNQNHQNKSLEYRIRYMMNEMTEDEFKQKIQQIDKDHNKRLEIGQVATTLIQVMTDLFIRLNNDGKTESFFKEYDEARVYFNDLFAKISKTYNCSVPQINEYCHIGFGKV